MRHHRMTMLAATAVIAMVGISDCTTPDESEGSSSEGTVPAWAKEPTDGGDVIATVEAGDVTVEVSEIGTAEAPKDGRWVDPDTNKPIIAKGDDIVFLNYVITNNGDDTIDLGSSLVGVEARYDDWKYAQGMGGITDSDLFEEVGVETSGPGEIADPTVYPLGPGEHFSYGENFHYQKDSPITFKVSIVPVEEKGDLIHEDKIEVEGKGTVS